MSGVGTGLKRQVVSRGKTKFGIKITFLRCHFCKGVFPMHDSELRSNHFAGRFCNKKCYLGYRHEHPAIKKILKIKKICIGCGRKYTDKKHNGRNTCSEVCASKIITETSRLTNKRHRMNWKIRKYYLKPYEDDPYLEKL